MTGTVAAPIPGAVSVPGAPVPAAGPGVDTTPPGVVPAGAPSPMPGAVPEMAPVAVDPAMDPAMAPGMANVPAAAAGPDKVEIILAVVAFLVTVGAVVVLAMMKVE